MPAGSMVPAAVIRAITGQKDHAARGLIGNSMPMQAVGHALLYALAWTVSS